MSKPKSYKPTPQGHCGHCGVDLRDKLGCHQAERRYWIIEVSPKGELDYLAEDGEPDCLGPEIFFCRACNTDVQASQDELITLLSGKKSQEEENV